MNYAVVYLVAILLFSSLYWVIRGRKHYTGPRLQVRVNEANPQDRDINENYDSKHTNAYSVHTENAGWSA